MTETKEVVMEITKVFTFKPHQDTYHTFFLINGAKSKRMAEKAFAAWGKDQGLFGRCGCTHDCCGHAFVRSWKLTEFDSIYQYGVVRVEGDGMSDLRNNILKFLDGAIAKNIDEFDVADAISQGGYTRREVLDECKLMEKEGLLKRDEVFGAFLETVKQDEF